MYIYIYMYIYVYIYIYIYIYIYLYIYIYNTVFMLYHFHVSPSISVIFPKGAHFLDVNAQMLLKLQASPPSMLLAPICVDVWLNVMYEGS